MDERQVFFIDRSLGRWALPDALRPMGIAVQVHDSHFAIDTADVDWIQDVATRGWIILTKDQNIRRNPREREAVIVSGAQVFTLTNGNMPSAVMVRLFAQYWADIERIAATEPGPFIYTISPAGLQRMHPASDADE